MSEASEQDLTWLRRAIALGAEALDDDEGGPFGAVVVRGGEVIGEGRNRVLADADPTAHAEVVALRAAARHVESHELGEGTLYTSCEPCPMCLAAASWAGVERIVFAATRADAAAIGFSDAELYEEMGRPLADRTLPIEGHLRADAQRVMQAWGARPDRRLY